MTKKGFKCPHCGVVHKEYVCWGKMSSPRCLNCNKLVKIDLVPSEYIQHRSKKRGKKRGGFTSLFRRERGEDTVTKGEEGRKKKKPVKGEEGRNEKKKEEEKRVSLFVKPKSSEKILEEVLREFGCDEFFINAMKRRSKRIGGMHPENLRNYLFQMKSGIGTKDQASYIAEEYGYALSDEEKKANEMGHKIAYPLRRRGHERSEPTFREGREYDYPEKRDLPPHGEPPRERRERDERVSSEDVRELIEDTLDRMEQKKEREEVLRNMGSRMTRLERDMASIPSRINEGLSKILEKSKEAEKPKEITEADIKNTVKNTALNLEKKYIERDFERSIKESKEREKEFQKSIEALSKERNELSKERNELLTKLAAKRTSDLSGYQSDSGRVIGEALSGLKDVIKTREPMRFVAEGLPKLLYPTGFGKGENIPEMKEEKIAGGGVAQYLDNEYVEES